MKNHKHVLPLILIISLIITSCTGPSKEIFKFIPESALAVVTVHPGQLLKKGKLQQLDFVNDAASETIFTQRILDDPASSGIDFDNYSAFFVFGKNPNYGSVIMPVDDKEKFEILLSDIENEVDEKMDRENLGDYDIIIENGNILVYDNTIAMIIFTMNGHGDEEIELVAENLLNLEKEQGILSDKDFNNFLRKQKDINAWFTSTNLNSIPGSGDLDDAMDLFGGIKNNYGHAFMDFQDGSMILTTNLRFNQTMQETIDKYNFLDENAIKDLLNYLPSEDIVFVGNTNVDPERIFDLLKFVNNDFDRIFEDLAETMEMDKEEIKKAFSGETAFSINGIRNFQVTKNDSVSFEEDMPSFVAASRMKNKDLFSEFLEIAEKQAEVKEFDGYYKVNNRGIPVYLILEGKDLVLSNTENVIKEIAENGTIANNVIKTDFGDILTENPVCFFLNLDEESYSEEVKRYINEEMDRDISRNYDRFGKKLKSLSFSANLEEWEVRLELMDQDENSLYTLLSQIDN